MVMGDHLPERGYEDKASFKCRRCRQYLFGDGCVRMMTHEENSGSLMASHQQQNSVWFIDQETAPQWVQDMIDKAQWTKGKLNCPKCQGRLGSFDFITPNKHQLSNASFSPIQVIQARVDWEPAKNALEKIHHTNHLLPMYQNGALSDVNVISSFAGATAAITTDDTEEVAAKLRGDDPDDDIQAGPEETRCENGLCTGDKERSELDFDDADRFGYSAEQNGDMEIRKRIRTRSDNHPPFERRKVVEEERDTRGAIGAANSGQHSPPLPDGDSSDGVDQSGQLSAKTSGNTDLPDGNPPGEEVSQSGQDSPPLQRRTVDLGDSNLLDDNVSGDEISHQSEQDSPLPRRTASQSDHQHSSPQRRSVDLEDSSLNDAPGVSEFLEVSFDGEDSASWEDFFDDIITEMHEMRGSPAGDGNVADDVNNHLDLDGDHTDGGSSTLFARHQGARGRAAVRRERNRRKRERRKQRRKEIKWMESPDDEIPDELDPSLSSLLEVLGTDWSRQSFQEVTTCSICLDVFYQPYSCVPCNHIFCEPCLRQLASVHHVVAPCPLCRTIIRTVTAHHELTAAIKRLFPGQVKRRYEAERRTLHRSYPLPGHSSHQGGPVTRPWFTIPRFRQSDTSSDRMQHFTSRVNRARQRRQQLHRSFLQELCSETTALLMFFVVFISVVIAFLTLMFEFS